MRENKIAPYAYIFPALLLIIVFVYIPIVQNFYFSFFKMSSYSTTTTFVGFENYIKIFSDDIFYTALRNNILYAVISLIFQVGLGLFLAILLESKYVSPKLQAFFRSIYFVPSVISITVVALLFQFIYNPEMGILNGILNAIGLGSLTHAWLGESKTAIFSIIAMSQWQYVGYIMMLFIVAIQKIPEELYEAAEIDGATGLQKALLITIPLVRDMSLVTSVITIIGAFKVFAEVYVMTSGGPGTSSHVLGTYLYRSAFINDEMGYASAIGVIIFIITISLSILQTRLSKGSE